ncbi:cell division protein FtsB [Halanaerobium saccharolyticum]|uniref:Cell division protein FtsB n=1 Tax=Halanaerobium saccharolyticum TaxID=43595 RepID=A0A4R7YN55_9FIRM|nr:septum formation initiator family protein [Halanaerobium saccharolyticum]RAK05125.1 cell division protein FtsB [Halanaerobium saccharolyticum]TDV98892.1 cell division protein FtsB [Halanaerobium saccharolyticum]TDX51594.1 cell division protein FtsB [Halanaerobium saccharolyticum]
MPRQRKDFLLNPAVITIVIVIAVVAAFNFYQNMTKMSQLENQIEEIEAQIAKAEAENEKLKKQLANSDSNEYIEEVAREKLGLVKPGEKMFIPVEEEENSDSDNKD